MQSLYSKVITEVTTEMPRSRSIFIQSERVWMRSFLAFTSPASWMAPPKSRSFSVSVVLPASGCAMMAKVRRRATASLMVSGISQEIRLSRGLLPARERAVERKSDRDAGRGIRRGMRKTAAEWRQHGPFGHHAGTRDRALRGTGDFS